MSKAYSEDLRQRIVEAIEGGMSRRQVAARYKVGVSSGVVPGRLRRQQAPQIYCRTRPCGSIAQNGYTKFLMDHTPPGHHAIAGRA